jgi:hypothetical protein
MVTEGPIPQVDINPGAKTEHASFEEAVRYLGQARAFAAAYFAAQAARIRVFIQNVILFGVLGVIALIVISTFAVVAVVLVCQGAAGGIGALLGSRQWAGDLIVGAIVLGGATFGSWLMISYLRKFSRRQTVAGYLKPKVPR